MFPSVLKKVRAGTVLLDLFWTPSHTQRVNSLQILGYLSKDIKVKSICSVVKACSVCG